MNVRFLSNQELDLNLKQLIVWERKILNLILEHILEIEKRKMYLEKAYASTYDYLVKELGYSGSAAMRRISAARLLKEVPGLSEEIKEGKINLSQITELSRAIKEKERNGDSVSAICKQEIVTAISGKNTSESQREICQKLDIALRPIEKTHVQKDDSVSVQLTLSKEQYEKLLICRNLASNKLLTSKSETTLVAVIDFLSDNYLSKFKKGPPKQPLDTYAEQTKFELNAPNFTHCRTKAVANRTLTPKNRIAVLVRDGHCQFHDPETGRVCESKFNLTVDHIHPQWAEGDHSIDNLQVLCQGHNNHKYRRESNLRLF